MANAVIGALRVNLGLDSAQFQTGLKNSKSRLDQFAAQAAKAFAAVAAAGVAMAGALAVGIKRTIDEADGMSKAAQKFGVGVEELSRLKHAADLSGVSMEGLGTGLRKLSQNMVEFANGAKNTAAQAFQALGISVKNADGTLKSSSQVMTEVAGKFAQMQDGAQKTSLAMAIFGKAGADLIPMLNAGADGLRSMMEEADRLGIVIDSNTARAAEAFNDNLTRMNRAKDGLIMKITSQLLPALELLAEKFIALVNDGERVEQIANAIGNVFRWVAVEAARVAGGIAGISSEIAGLGEALKRLGSFDFSGARDAWNEGQEAAKRVREEWTKAVEEVFDGTRMSQGQIQRRIDDAFGTAGAGAAEKFVASFEKASGSGGGRARAALDPMAHEAARIFEQTRTPLEQYQAQIARLNDLLRAGAIDQDTYNRAVIQAQDAFDRASKMADRSMNQMRSTGETVGSTLANAFMSLTDRARSFSDVLKDVLRQLASMALNSAFQKIFGGIFSGFGGLKLPGFANGGSFRVGGAGGIDSQMVAFRASPDERVTITKPGQNAGGSMHVTFGLASDGALNIMPVVREVAQGEARTAAMIATSTLAGQVGGMVDARIDASQTRGMRS